MSFTPEVFYPIDNDNSEHKPSPWITREVCAKETPLSITSTNNAIYELMIDVYVQVTFPKSAPSLIGFNKGDKLRLIHTGCKPAPVGELTAWRYGDWGVAWIDVQFMKHISGALGNPDGDLDTV